MRGNHLKQHFSGMNRLISILLLTAVVLVSCKKDTGGDGTEPAAISISVTDARPLQFLSVELVGTYVNAESYSGSIGGVEVAFYPSNEQNMSTLVCVVPENVGIGMQTISIDIDGQTLTSTVNVLPNETITNPEDVFDGFYADYTTAEYTGFIDEAELQTALDELRALPENERLMAAQMLANNRVVLDNIALAIADAEAETALGFGKTDSGCDLLCIVGATTAVIGGFLSAPIVTTVGVGILAGLVAKALKPVITALWNKLVTGVVAAVRLGYDRMSYLTELVFDEADQFISNKVDEVPDTIYLENGRSLKLAIKTVREPLISENNRDEYPEVGSFLDMYYRLQNFLVGTDYQVPGLESGEVLDFAQDLDGFSISVDNPLVTVSPITGTPELAEVVFDSPQQGAHIFNFTYSYENEEGLVSSFTQTARLLNIDVHTSWSGLGTSFSSTNDLRDVRGYVYSSEHVSISMGNNWLASDPSATGIVTLNSVHLTIRDYHGPDVYTTSGTVSPYSGVTSVHVQANAEYDVASGNFGGSDYCYYNNTSAGEGYQATITINEEEWIGPYLVLDGTFSFSIDANATIYGTGNCVAPQTISGNFRAALVEP